MLKIIRYLYLAVFLLLTDSLFSQDIYTTEIGIHGGGSYFIGDVENQPLQELKQSVGMTYRHLFNQRISIQADYNYSKIAGTYNQPFPGIYSSDIQLQHAVNLIDVSFVFNFLDYGKLDYILKSNDYTVYLFGGVGVIEHNDLQAIDFSLPLGVGFKTKLAERLHLNMQWTHRLMFSDRLENDNQLNNPLELNGSNFLNHDYMGTFTIGLSYSFFKRKCKCMNYN